MHRRFWMWFNSSSFFFFQDQDEKIKEQIDEVNDILLSATTILVGPQKVNSELSEVIKVGASVTCLNYMSWFFELSSHVFRSLNKNLSFFILLQLNTDEYSPHQKSTNLPGWKSL